MSNLGLVLMLAVLVIGSLALPIMALISECIAARKDAPPSMRPASCGRTLPR